MLNRFRASALAVVLGLTCASSALAAGSAGPFKVAYLDSEKLKVGFPEAARAENTKQMYEAQLRDIVARANTEIEKAQKDKKEPAELEKMKHDLQLQINGMQQAFNLAVQTASAEANQRINAAANAVAKEKGVDLVIDARNMPAGADKLAGCEDVTDAVLKKLNPALAATAKQ